MYTTLSLMNEFLHDIYNTTTTHTRQKKTPHDALDDSTRILHQAATSCQKRTVLLVGHT